MMPARDPEPGAVTLNWIAVTYPTKGRAFCPSMSLVEAER